MAVSRAAARASARRAPARRARVVRAAVEREAAKDAAPAKVSAPKFFAVEHTFSSPAKADEWWAGITEFMATEGAMEAKAAEWRALGYANTFFMPQGGAEPILCVWETQYDVTDAEFQAFIDGPDSPAGALDNQVFGSIPGVGALPETAFPTGRAAIARSVSDWLGKLLGKEPATPKATTGCFFWVRHELTKSDAEKYLEAAAEVPPEDMAAMYAAWNEAGWHNHMFMPTAPGPEPTSFFCVWEAKDDVEAAAFQEFIDGPSGPGALLPGAAMRNIVHKVAPGAALPSAHFSA